MAAKLEAAEYLRLLALGEEAEGPVKNISPSGEGWRAVLYDNPPGWWPSPAEKQFNGPTRATRVAAAQDLLWHHLVPAA